jgi:hypothetical protein
MKIFKIVCLMVLWLSLFVACAAAYFFHPELVGWNMTVAAIVAIVIMIAASLFITEAFD